MKTPTILVTVLTVAAAGATPAVAATGGPKQAGCSPIICGVTGNHNEVLAASIGA